MAELLSLRGVGKGYRRGGRWLRVLVDVSLDVAPGELVAVVGGRGEGKTTLLEVAAGLRIPDEGEVWMGEVDLACCSEGERSRRLGGEIAWVHHGGTGVKFEVVDYVGLPLAMGRGMAGARPKVSRWMRWTASASADCAHQRWEELSNWERVLVGLARGMRRQAELMIVDDVATAWGCAGRARRASCCRARGRVGVRGVDERLRSGGRAGRRSGVVLRTGRAETAVRSEPHQGRHHRFLRDGRRPARAARAS